METQYKPNMDGVESRGSDVKVANPRTVRSSDFFLRFLAIVTTLIPIIIISVGKETKLIPVTLFPNLPPVTVEATAKWQYMSAFVYFVVSNAIACVYAALSLILLMANRAGSKGVELTLIVVDLIMVALLFSGIGAAAAVGVIGYNGNSHVQWNKVCDVFGKYCHHLTASVVVSAIGSAIFILLIVLATLKIYRRSSR